MSKVVVPSFGQARFICLWCQAFAQQKWFERVYANNPGSGTGSEAMKAYAVSVCASCLEATLWHKGVPFFPRKSAMPPPVDDMPNAVKQIYEEAAEVQPTSPRAAAAFLRLALQLLCKELGKKGENINDDIAALVADGMSPKIQQAMDILRVIGNNAVHPGQIDIADDERVCIELFRLINVIVETMITHPKTIDALYMGLPKSNLDAIEKRNEKAKSKK